ncbi:MAG: HAD hydrolase family protein [Coriobacteriales bacterium]
MRRRYCFFDYDGTLRSRALDAVPSSARAALDKLREAGHFIALATGRLQSDALEVLAPCGIDTMVADGGNSITIDGKLVSIEGLPLAPTRDFVHRLDGDGWAWAVNHENRRTCLTRDERYAGLVKNLYYTPIVDPQLDIDRLDPIYKVFVPCKRGAEEAIDFTGVTWARYSDELVYVEPTHKSRGIRTMMGLLDAPVKDVVVFGDGSNDIEMFRPEWTCVAMGNAIPELKERADLVTSSVDDDGIWNACVKLGLIDK